MLRFWFFIFVLIGFEASACRIPYKVSGALIEMDYLDIKGRYSIKLPARIGDSQLASAGLFYKKLNSSDLDVIESGTEIKLELVGETLIGEFNAFSKLGYEAWIKVSWNTLVCPIISNKKIKLFPRNA